MKPWLRLFSRLRSSPSSTQMMATESSFCRHNFRISRRISTAVLGPKKLRGVVIINPQVHGVVGLSIIDYSIIPMVPGSQIEIMTYAVDEKGVALILGHASSQR
ncbi:hypothetical protein S40285_10846 [Stachybotrys chlorohalonatus IBT 40285]|uniref:Glucose-methanol-choline oxidoreductase C-terminal domain-containing protein n=1 Tax=Stachybotrys chlorohalonatus (strain IBT 40285) TaxID=1283841 RepID=A0A084QV57_STAC4|nr:hypothetical protein S40285_10846 [Stachybotrys chlorohalonata IBT 40285]